MALNWVPIVAATVAAVPAAAVFFVSYGRYDGAFQDRTIFLYFLGGLGAGAFLGALTLAFRAAPFVLLPVVALFYPILLVLVVNRRKWQGNRHAIFNGGAAGLGAAVMVAFSLVYERLFRPMQAAQQAADAALRETSGNPQVKAPPVDSVPFAFDLTFLPQAALVAIGLAGLLFGLGLLAGDGVHRRAQFRVAFLGTAILLPAAVFLGGFFADDAWLWPVLLAAYGAVVGVLADRRILWKGLTDEERRKRRRRQRADAVE